MKQLLAELIHTLYEGVYEEERIDIALNIAFNNKTFDINNIEDVVLLKEFVVYCASNHDLRGIKFNYMNEIVTILRDNLRKAKNK